MSGAVVSVEERVAQQRVPMSWEQFVALPDDGFAEWVDGVAVVSPRPTARHGAVVMRVGAALVGALPGLEVIAEAGVWLPGNRLRGPDLMVVVDLGDTAFVEDVPLLVVEVLSPITRAEDLLRKGPEYAAAGIGQYWVVDPEARSIDVHELVDGAWALLLRLDEHHPAGEVAVGDHGVVRLDLVALLPAPATG